MVQESSAKFSEVYKECKMCLQDCLKQPENEKDVKDPKMKKDQGGKRSEKRGINLFCAFETLVCNDRFMSQPWLMNLGDLGVNRGGV